MSDQSDDGSSTYGHCSESLGETVFCNINSDKHRMPINYFGLINKVPYLSEYTNNCRDQMGSTTSGQSLLPSSAGKNVGSKSKNTLESNPVGTLQELCVARHYPFPNYTFSAPNLENLNARFTVTCSLFIYKTSGSGVTKQGAKNKAAYLMYKEIEKMALDPSFCSNNNECDFNNDYFNHGSYFCRESVNLLKDFFDAKSASETPHLQNIKKNSYEFKLTAFDTFKIVLANENLTFEHTTFSEKRDEVYVMIQVNTSPVLVISKSGKNEFEARESAALALLACFKS